MEKLIEHYPVVHRHLAEMEEWASNFSAALRHYSGATREGDLLAANKLIILSKKLLMTQEGCDFVVVPASFCKGKNINGLPGKSRNAYVLTEDYRHFFYINKITGECVSAWIDNPNFYFYQEDRQREIFVDFCNALLNNNKTPRLICVLTEDQLQHISSITGHSHSKESFKNGCDFILMATYNEDYSPKALPGKSKYAYVCAQYYTVHSLKSALYFVDKVNDKATKIYSDYHNQFYTNKKVIKKLGITPLSNDEMSRFVCVLSKEQLDQIYNITKTNCFLENKDEEVQNSNDFSLQCLADIPLSACLTSEQWMFLASDAIANPYYESQIKGIRFALQAARKAEETAITQEECQESKKVSVTAMGMFKKMTNPEHPDYELHLQDNAREMFLESAEIIAGYYGNSEARSTIIETFATHDQEIKEQQCGRSSKKQRVY